VTPTEPEEHGRGRDRVLAFSDGVFAIAATLLVLNLKAPHLTGADLDQQLRHALGKEGGVLVGFVISFYVIARYWMVHHRLSLLLRRVDGRFIMINLVFLAFIVFLPFPAEIIGLYGGTVTAVVLYSATMVAIGVLSLTLWEYAFRVQLTGPVPAGTVQASRTRSLIPITVFGSSIPLAFVSPSAAQAWWVLLVAYPVLEKGFVMRRHRRAGPPRAPSIPAGGPGSADAGPST
jgi:uncharacterized membrane protein